MLITTGKVTGVAVSSLDDLALLKYLSGPIALNLADFKGPRLGLRNLLIRSDKVYLTSCV